MTARKTSATKPKKPAVAEAAPTNNAISNADAQLNPIVPVNPASPVVRKAKNEPSLFDIIAGVIANPDVNVDKIQALLDMKKKEQDDERRMFYNEAMWAAQGEMVPIVTKSWNESTKSYFAKLAHVDNIIRPIYFKHGFSLSFTSKKEDDGSITMKVKVKHRGGWEDDAYLNAHIDDKGPKGTPNKTQPQGVASTATILQRKLTVMVFNLTFINEDDDGQGGKKNKDKSPERDSFAAAARAEADAANKVALGKGDDKDATKLQQAAEFLIDKLKACKTQEGKDRIMGANLKLVRAVDSLDMKATLDIINRNAKVEVAHRKFNADDHEYVKLGAAIRAARHRAGVSQDELAKRMKPSISFQQIQKYEMGKNRVAALTLLDIANILGVNVSEFYEGIETTDKKASDMNKADGTLIRDYHEIPSPAVQAALRSFVSSLARGK